MKKRAWLFWVLGVVLLAACQSGDKGPQGFILYQSLAEDGQPEELVVVNPQGEEQHRLDLSELVTRGYPARSGPHALLYTTDEKTYLVDAKQGTLRELVEGAVPFAAQFRFSGGGERWVLLGSPRGDVTYLINLESGHVRDMTTLDESAPPIFFGLFAPDEEHLLLGVGSDLWLVPTEGSISAARRLGTERTTYASSFSNDGKQVAYVQRDEAGQFQVVLEKVDGSDSEVVASAGFIGDIAFVPGKKQLIVMMVDRESSESKVILLSLDDGQERELLAHPGRALRPWFSPNGKKLLLGIETDEAITWHLVDLGKGTTQALDDLEGYGAYYWDRDHRWLIFLDSFQLGGGRRFFSLDLESGETHHLLAFDQETRYMNILDVARDGKFGLVIGLTEDNMTQLWLIRADGGDPRLLVEKRGAQAVFSPDGQWIAVGTLERVDDRTEAQVVLMETGGDEIKDLGEGFRPFWVRP